jgi:hypothetical protein
MVVRKVLADVGDVRSKYVCIVEKPFGRSCKTSALAGRFGQIHERALDRDVTVVQDGKQRVRFRGRVE